MLVVEEGKFYSDGYGRLYGPMGLIERSINGVVVSVHQSVFGNECFDTQGRALSGLTYMDNLAAEVSGADLFEAMANLLGAMRHEYVQPEKLEGDDETKTR
jgi:hypothetical protein